MAKATTTIKQVINYQPDHAAWFAANQVLFNQNADLWRKISNCDEHIAHLVSARSVQFAKEHGATILVFEHLGNLKPAKGKYSHRGNAKRAYWMKGRIFSYAKYKAWKEGIITSRVSPRNTSHECACCHSLVARYEAGAPAEGYTPGAPLVLCQACGMQGNADRNASLVIGQRLVARSQKLSQGKPHAPLATERGMKVPGVAVCQAAKSEEGPSMLQARHTDRNEHGTAQETEAWMDASVPDIPRQLRVRRIGGEEGAQQKLLELMEGSMHTSLTPNLERGGRPEHARKAA